MSKEAGWRAPCVAVVGPANAGKTTLLHLLDEALQKHESRVRTYVVKGSPDGTGRYLLHAPELRQSSKERVKGVWCDSTVETVRGWIDNARASLELVLLDFGGRHAPMNEQMLRRCSHYLVVSRATEKPEESKIRGRDSWITVCWQCGLAPVGSIRSQWASGKPAVSNSETGSFEATFRADACMSGDAINRKVVARLVQSLVDLCRPGPSPLYLNLALDRDWTPTDLYDIGGLEGRLEELARGQDRLVLGGRAPLWAYCAAMHQFLDRRRDAEVAVFDPKVASGFVEIAKNPAVGRGSAFADAITARWKHDATSGIATLDLRLRTRDKFLPMLTRVSTTRLPRPSGEAPGGDVVITGVIPIWLHLAYSRWLRSLVPRPSIGTWDARFGKTLWVAGSRSRRSPGNCDESAHAPVGGEGVRPQIGGDRCGEC